MSEGIIAKKWLKSIDHLNSLSSIMKNKKLITYTDFLNMTTSEKLWIIVGVLNVALVIELVFFSAKHIIAILIFLTGGYSV